MGPSLVEIRSVTSD